METTTQDPRVEKNRACFSPPAFEVFLERIKEEWGYQYRGDHGDPGEDVDLDELLDEGFDEAVVEIWLSVSPLDPTFTRHVQDGLVPCLLNARLAGGGSLGLAGYGVRGYPREALKEIGLDEDAIYFAAGAEEAEFLDDEGKPVCEDCMWAPGERRYEDGEEDGEEGGEKVRKYEGPTTACAECVARICEDQP